MRSCPRLLLTTLALHLLLVPLVALAQECHVQAHTDTQATIAWTAVTPPPGLTLRAYNVQRQVDHGPWQERTRLAPEVLQWTDSGLEPGKHYLWGLNASAQDSAGQEVPSELASHGIPPPCVQMQAVPLLVIANIRVLPACGAQCMMVSWESSDEQALIEVEYQQLPQTTWRSLGEPVPGMSLAHSGLAAQTTFCYRLRHQGTPDWTTDKRACGRTGGRP